MCFCLLPVTGFKFEFVFERESTGLANLDSFYTNFDILTANKGF